MSADVMLDIETCGTDPGCVVLSIGACTLDEKYKFYERIAVQSAREAGLIEDPATIAWWNKQSPAARAEAFSGILDIVEVLVRFEQWMKQVERDCGEVFVWGNGADFDQPILKAAYKAIGLKAPWKPFNARCYRTLKNLPQYKQIPLPGRVGTHHQALDDAIFQARHMMAILRSGKSQEAN